MGDVATIPLFFGHVPENSNLKKSSSSRSKKGRFGSEKFRAV